MQPAMAKLLLLLVAAALSAVEAKVYFEERFGEGWEDRWVKSAWKEGMGEWAYGPGEWFAAGQEDNAKGIITTTEMAHHAISAKMGAAASTTGGQLVVQFTVKHEQPKGDSSFCGGGYIKLLPDVEDQGAFGGDTPYALMFGPDLCGYDVARIHLIFAHGAENLLKETDIPLSHEEKDKRTHVYTLVLDAAAGTYEVLFDLASKAKGSLSEEWGFPSETIPDPTASKPADWVEEAMIVDPAASKPAGFDDVPENIPDPEAEKPEDWIDEDDGEWDAPLVANPEWAGEWVAPMVENPAYEGAWEHPTAPNPAYAPESYARYEALSHVGFELWSVHMGSLFDNVLVTDDLDYAKAMAAETWSLLQAGEEAAQEAWDKEHGPAPAPDVDLGPGDLAGEDFGDLPAAEDDGAEVVELEDSHHDGEL